MSTGPLFKNRYRIQSARWQGWNYSWNGRYFVTICTKDRFCYFGRVVENKMVLSDIGLVVKEEWLKTGKMRDNIRLGEWVIMPNHVHMVVEINKGDAGLAQNMKQDDYCRDEARLVSTGERKKSPKPDSLASIIGSFKSACSKIVHQKYPDIHFAWQPRFHDHVIRDEFELHRIRKYVRENPETWGGYVFCAVNEIIIHSTNN